MDVLVRIPRGKRTLPLPHQICGGLGMRTVQQGLSHFATIFRCRYCNSNDILHDMLLVSGADLGRLRRRIERQAVAIEVLHRKYGVNRERCAALRLVTPSLPVAL